MSTDAALRKILQQTPPGERRRGQTAQEVSSDASASVVLSACFSGLTGRYSTICADEPVNVASMKHAADAQLAGLCGAADGIERHLGHSD